MSSGEKNSDESQARLHAADVSPVASTASNSKLAGILYRRRGRSNGDDTMAYDLADTPPNALGLNTGVDSSNYSTVDASSAGLVDVLQDDTEAKLSSKQPGRFMIRRRPSRPHDDSSSISSVRFSVSNQAGAPSRPDQAHVLDRRSSSSASSRVSNPTPAGPSNTGHLLAPSRLPTTASALGRFNEVANDSFLPRRLSGWFSNVLRSSNSSPSTSRGQSPAAPNTPSSSSPSTSSPSSPQAQRVLSPSRAGTSPLSASQSLRPGAPRALAGLDRMLDKAVNYFLDTDSNVDKCADDIWLMGVLHEGWRPSLSEPNLNSADNRHLGIGRKKGRLKGASSSPRQAREDLRSTFSSKKERERDRADSVSVASSQRSSPSRAQSESPTGSPSPMTLLDEVEPAQSSNSLQTYGWPAPFYLDFTSQIQLTYRSGFVPIPCSTSSFSTATSAVRHMMGTLSASIGRGSSNVVAQANADGLTSDAGWGCMLRTGQSLLANALVRIHLGRGQRAHISYRTQFPP